MVEGGSRLEISRADNQGGWRSVMSADLLLLYDDRCNHGG